MPPATTLSHQSIVAIQLSDAERESQTISDEHLGAALVAMHRDGTVVLNNAVDLEHVDQLNRILCAEAAVMANMPTTHFNNVSHFENNLTEEKK